ncbi:MAG: phage baseplate assembly protein V [Rhodobacteraceae bacterium]|nr:phage baseplate assembly protein V [Paracoccaceae bacterium]
MSFESAEADRRIGNLLSIGKVSDVYPNGTARVQIGDLTTAPISVGKLRAGAMQVWWMPSLGEQVLVAAPSGDMARAVIVCAILAGNAPSADIATPVIDLRGGEMVIRGAKLKIEADLEIDGTIDITGNVTSAADVVASGISLKTHVHGGVVSGGSTTAGPQ